MVKMVLGSSDAQGQTMSSVGNARVTAYNSAVTALSNFNGAGDLQGSAYDSGKKYGVSVITPLIKGAIMYSEYLSEAVPKLPSKYRSEVGDEDLDSAVLESEIQSLESSISGIRGTYRAMEGSDHADRNLLKSISDRMDSLTSQKNEKMDKLRKLNLFAGSSNEVFSGEGAKSMDTVVKNLSAGLNMIHGDFASFGGTFPKHSGKTLNWAKSIEGEWDKKAKIDEDYQKVLEKIKDGKELNEDDVKKIDAYKKRYSNRELPENVKEAVKEEHRRNSKEISKEEAASILGVPSLNELLGDVKTGSEAAFTYRGAHVFLNGIEITVDSEGRMRWGNKFIYKQSYLYSNGKALEEASGLDLENYHYSGNLKGAARLKEMGKAGWSGFKEAVNPLNDFKGWKEVGKFGKAAKGAGILLTAWNVKDNWEKNVNVKDGISAKEVRDFAIDTTVDIGSGAAATGFGAAIGSAFLPPLGTVIGAGAGAFANYVLNDVHIPFLKGETAVDFVKGKAKEVGNWLGGLLGG